MGDIKLGILEFGTGGSYGPITRIENTIDYAVKADELGYSRFWLSEHHQFYGKAPWSNPEMLLPIVACMTERIKIGLAGILLKLHSPYRVALNFKLLANMFPDRIDLGFAKGVPNNSEIIQGLLGHEEIQPSSFSNKLNEVVHFLRQEETLYKMGIVIPPLQGELPGLWYLSGSNHSLDSALENRMDYSRTIFHEQSDLSYEKDKLIAFRENFKNRYGFEAKVNIAFAGYLGETSKSALENYRKIIDDKEYQKKYDKYSIVGCKNEFYDTLLSHSENYGVDEFIFLNMETNHERKLESLEVLGSLFNFSTVTP